MHISLANYMLIQVKRNFPRYCTLVLSIAPLLDPCLIKQTFKHYVKIQLYTLPKTNKAPEDGWLGDHFPFGRSIFSGATCACASLTRLTHGHLQGFPGQSFSSLVTDRTQALRDIGRKLEKPKMQNCMQPLATYIPISALSNLF